MEDHPLTKAQPPEIPPAAQQNPYVSPNQPPMLPQQYSHVDASGLTQDDRSMGMLVHLLGLLTGFLGVLIMWLVKKDQSKFVDFHGREALNFFISVLIYTVVLVIVGLVLGVVTMFLGMFIIFPFIFIIGIGQIVCGIMACVAANRGEWHRYPMTIRFIPDASSTR